MRWDKVAEWGEVQTCTTANNQSTETPVPSVKAGQDSFVLRKETNIISSSYDGFFSVFFYACASQSYDAFFSYHKAYFK